MVDWFDGDKNFGDILNKYLIEKITNRYVINISNKYIRAPHLLAIGSILQKSNENSVIWGSGLISENEIIPKHIRKIYAVRGPLTKKILDDHGVECPHVFGDPGLLLPNYYKPRALGKRYKIGIIPHLVDQTNPLLVPLSNENDILIINLKNKNPLKVVDQICSCDAIASSSLHGLIIADAYGIPSVWVEFSHNVRGSGFKFRDYYMSIGQDICKPVECYENLDPDALVAMATQKYLNVDLELLIENFPHHWDIRQKYHKFG